MPTATIHHITSFSGMAVLGKIERTATGQMQHKVTLPAGQSGTLTTRASDYSGTVTLAAGHGFQVGDLVDVYWNGMAQMYGGQVTGVSGNDVSFAAPNGAPLPALGSTIVLAKVVSIACGVDLSLLKLLAAQSDQHGFLTLRGPSGEQWLAVPLLAGLPFTYTIETWPAGPGWSGYIQTIRASTGAARSATLRIGILYQSA
jgi:hypothetical protein